MVRGVVVLHTDIATGVWASQTPGVVALVACMVFTRFRVPALKRHLRDHLAQPAPNLTGVSLAPLSSGEEDVGGRRVGE